MFPVISDSPPSTLLEDCRATWAASKLQDCYFKQELRTIRPRPLKVEELRPHPGLVLLDLDDAYLAAVVPSVSSVVVLDQQTRGLLRSLPVARPVDEGEREGLIELYRQGLLVGDEPGPVNLQAPGVLSAWLHVTNACNLRCSYCYLQKTAEAMSAPTGLAAIDAIFRSARAHTYRAVALKYAGGEATLELGLVEQLHRYAMEQAERFDIELHGGVLSNGTTLTGERVERLKRLGLRLMISLDGIGAAHDEQRPTATGRPSFPIVQRSIERALAHGLRPDVAVTVTGRSVDGLPALVDWLAARDLPFSISFYREHELSAELAELQLDEQRIIAGMRAAYRVLERNPTRWSVLGALLDRADLSAPHPRPCDAGQNYLVIDHQGGVAKCQMEIRHRLTTVAADDPLALVRADRGGLQNPSVDEKEGCRTCEWRYWCAGGCPVATFRATGRYDVRSPNCNIYRALYPDLVRLEGRRILHWHRRQTELT